MRDELKARQREDLIQSEFHGDAKTQSPHIRCPYFIETKARAQLIFAVTPGPHINPRERPTDLIWKRLHLGTKSCNKQVGRGCWPQQDKNALG